MSMAAVPLLVEGAEAIGESAGIEYAQWMQGKVAGYGVYEAVIDRNIDDKAWRYRPGYRSAPGSLGRAFYNATDWLHTYQHPDSDRAYWAEAPAPGGASAVIAVAGDDDYMASHAGAPRLPGRHGVELGAGK